MKTAIIPQSPALARALARALRDQGPLSFLSLAEELSLAQPQAFLESLSPNVTREPAVKEAFPDVDFSLSLDADPEEDVEPVERSLGLAVCLSPALWRLGADFGSADGERARDLFSRLGQAQLQTDPLRSEFLREALGGALWSSTPRARLTLSGTAPKELDQNASELSVSFWRQVRTLRMIDPCARDIHPYYEEDDLISGVELALLAVGCPPKEEEAAWLLKSLGGRDALQKGWGGFWAQHLAEVAAETLNAPALELAAPELTRLGRDDRLARALWPALAEASALSWEFIEEASFERGPFDERPEQTERARAEAFLEITEACRRCCQAAAPCGPPSALEISDFPERLRSVAQSIVSADPEKPPFSEARVIAHDFRKKN